MTKNLSQALVAALRSADASDTARARQLMTDAADCIEEYARTAAEPEADSDAEDAARYRWLKANHLQTGPDSWIRTGEDLEEAIDAAMR